MTFVNFTIHGKVPSLKKFTEDAAMSKLIGKGFQVLSIKDGKSIEVLYWLAPNAMCFTTWERPFDSVNFDKVGQEWNFSEGLPASAVYIGTYEKPAAVSATLVRV